MSGNVDGFLVENIRAMLINSGIQLVGCLSHILLLAFGTGDKVNDIL